MGNQDDPFAAPPDIGRTVLKPRPGGSGTSPSPAPPAAPEPRSGRAADWSDEQADPQSRAGLNPLEKAASSLLALLARLKHMVSQPDPEALLQQVIQEVKEFELKARGFGQSPETVFLARYVLCAALDEAVRSTPWGSNSVWNKQGLLITFHGEAWAGEKFFAILERLIQDPASNLDLLELMYICMALGFQGRYAVTDGGEREWEEQRRRLYRTLRAHGRGAERDLSPRWAGVTESRNPLIRYVPLWVVSAVAGVVLLLGYAGFKYSLADLSGPVAKDLVALEGKAERKLIRPEIPVPRPQPVARGPELRELLESDIRAGRIEMAQDSVGVLIRIRGEGLFGSGSAQVQRGYVDVLRRVGDALNRVEGSILVTGHTDAVPIRTLRFPSNWELSEARAKAVRELLVSRLDDPNRVRAEGRADSQLLVPENPRDPRNRRVEITLRSRVRG